jgi:SH3-like domain-containing protein
MIESSARSTKSVDLGTGAGSTIHGMDDTLPRAMVLKSYTPEPGSAIQLGAGDPVRVGEESTAYPGWVRITAPNGSKTWAPGAYVRGEPGTRGAMTVEYDSTELAVKEREKVTVSLEYKGWAWVRTDDGRAGWIPLGVLGPFSGLAA